LVPETPEAPVYDLDGNLTQDGLWTYTWDAENRLTRIETRTNAITDSAYWQRIECTYDYQSRRVRKQVYGWTGTAWTKTAGQRFLYDGWNLIGQVDEVTGIRLSFVWGTDLSGTMQGAKSSVQYQVETDLAGSSVLDVLPVSNLPALLNATEVNHDVMPFFVQQTAIGLMR
jgi:YD repeat-containing protein